MEGCADLPHCATASPLGVHCSSVASIGSWLVTTDDWFQSTTMRPLLPAEIVFSLGVEKG
jgi:hypothetical protein